MKTIVLTDDELRMLIADEMRKALAVATVKPLEPLYTIADACKLLQKDEHTLRRWANNGTIEIAMFGGARYVTGKSIAARL